MSLTPRVASTPMCFDANNSVIRLAGAASRARARALGCNSEASSVELPAQLATPHLTASDFDFDTQRGPKLTSFFGAETAMAVISTNLRPDGSNGA